MENQWNPPRLFEISGSYWQSSALQAAVRLDLFTPLAVARLTPAALAQQLGCDERALAMLLRALSAMGLLEKDGTGYHCPAPQSSWLNSSSEQYLGHIIRHHHHLVDGWNKLDRAVQTGGPQRDQSRFSEEEWRQDFLCGMHSLSSQLAPQLIPLLPLESPERLLDVGGGPGTWALHFCQSQPQLRATVFDLPESRPIFTENIAAYQMSERIDFVGGNFLQDPLGQDYDLAWLSHVLHGEGPEQAGNLVAHAARALRPGGTLLIHEFILHDQEDGPLFPALFALNMLIGTEAGQAYSEQELTEFCHAGGLHEIERVVLPEKFNSGVLVARKPE